jgi:hypothetical protein
MITRGGKAAMCLSLLSVADLSPTNLSDGEERLIVLLRSYFDGGNQADSTQYDFVSLAAASGTEDEWKPFERDWREMLLRHHAVYLHTTDAVSRVNDFKGWTEDEVDSFLRDATRIIEKHFIRLNTEYVAGKFGLFCFVVTIDLKDFVQRAKDNPGHSLVATNANEACIRQAIGDVLGWGIHKAYCDQIHCIFDQGEPFYGYLVAMLNSKQARKDSEWLNKIVARTEADSRITPALQMADIFAWVESHKKDDWNPTWKQRILRLPYWREWWDKTNLHDVNVAHQAAWLRWGSSATQSYSVGCHSAKYVITNRIGCPPIWIFYN